MVATWCQARSHHPHGALARFGVNSGDFVPDTEVATLACTVTVHAFTPLVGVPVAATSTRVDPCSPRYARRRPETSVLYGIVQQHLATFLARTDVAPDRRPLPSWVRRELERYLSCGILAKG